MVQRRHREYGYEAIEPDDGFADYNSGKGVESDADVVRGYVSSPEGGESWYAGCAYQGGWRAGYESIAYVHNMSDEVGGWRLSICNLW